MKPIHPSRGAKADPHGPGCFCGGESFSPDVAYDSAWDSVMPTKGIHFQLLPVPRHCCVAMSCGGGFSLLMVLTILFGTVSGR